MDLNVNNVKLDEIHIKVHSGGPELMLYMSLFNKAKSRIGQVYMSTQKHYSDTQYKIDEVTMGMINALVDNINKDVFDNYVTLNRSS